MSAEKARQIGTRPRSVRRFRAVLLAWAAALAAADLVIKAAAEVLLSDGQVNDLGLINFRLLYNPGVAFSFGSSLPSWAVIAATGLIIVALTWYLLSSAPTMTGLSRAGGALLLGGAMGNFIDRLDGLGVVDYLHTGWFPTFNLADAFVTTGAAILVLAVFLHPRTAQEQ